VPFSLLIFNVADIVSHLCVSDVADYSCQFVLIVGIFFSQIGIVLLFSLEVVKGIGVDVEAGRELVLVG